MFDQGFIVESVSIQGYARDWIKAIKLPSAAPPTPPKSIFARYSIQDMVPDREWIINMKSQIAPRPTKISYPGLLDCDQSTFCAPTNQSNKQASQAVVMNTGAADQGQMYCLLA